MKAKVYTPPPGLNADGTNQRFTSFKHAIEMVLNVLEIEVHKALTVRQEQFKTAALDAKHKGDTTIASKYMRSFKVSK